jgi:hypothetical protein
MPTGGPTHNDYCASPIGTPRRPITWSARCLNAQTLPAQLAATAIYMTSLPASDPSNTSGAVLIQPLNVGGLAELSYLADHASAVASKSGTARHWLVREGVFEDKGGIYEYSATPAFDVTVGVGASPILVPSAAYAHTGGSTQVATADALAVLNNYLPSPSGVTIANGATALSVLFDPRGAKYLMTAGNIGTLTGFRTGVRQL